MQNQNGHRNRIVNTLETSFDKLCLPEQTKHASLHKYWELAKCETKICR